MDELENTLLHLHHDHTEDVDRWAALQATAVARAAAEENDNSGSISDDDNIDQSTDLGCVNVKNTPQSMPLVGWLNSLPLMCICPQSVSCGGCQEFASLYVGDGRVNTIFKRCTPDDRELSIEFDPLLFDDDQRFTLYRCTSKQPDVIVEGGNAFTPSPTSFLDTHPCLKGTQTKFEYSIHDLLKIGALMTPSYPSGLVYIEGVTYSRHAHRMGWET
jgi:hypothetical protein